MEEDSFFSLENNVKMTVGRAKQDPWGPSYLKEI
jgi:hypothetical protein